MIQLLLIAFIIFKSWVTSIDGAFAFTPNQNQNHPTKYFVKDTMQHYVIPNTYRYTYTAFNRAAKSLLNFSKKEWDFDRGDDGSSTRAKSKGDDFDIDYNDDDDERDFFDDDNFDDYEYEESEDDDSWEWEPYQKSTHVYLPPNYDTSQQQQPTPRTIIHFIGGTLFGSYPLQFYKPLLEQIAERTNSIMVASSIPVSFQSNPLNHNKLTYRICRSFRDAYKDVICDEYGTRQARQMKIVGMGHSLGTRLQCVISTEKVLKELAMGREGNILISFNNFNAASTVPGVQKLERGVKETLREEEGRRKRWRTRQQETDRYAYDGESDFEDDMYDDSRKGKRSTSSDKYDEQRRTKGRRERDYYDDYDDDDYYDDDDDIDFDELVSSVSTGIKDRITGIKTAITPDIQKASLEFRPSPEKLWDRIKGGSYNQYVNNTLIVQFDGDTIDQSSQLAKAILTANDKNETETTDIKFARLRGSHLTPVSYSDSFGLMQAWSRISSSSPMDTIIEEALGEERKSSKRKRGRKEKFDGGKNDMDDLVASIVKYIELIISPEYSEVQSK